MATSIGLLVPIAPAPPKTPSTGAQSGLDKKRFNCQACVRKKVKCDRALPACSSCSRTRLECVYQAPPPKRRRRGHFDDVHERLALYEHILRDNQLLPADPTTVPPTEAAEPEVGKLVSADGEYRYVDSSLLLDAEQDELYQVSDFNQSECEKEGGSNHPGTSTGLLGFLAADIVSDAILARTRSLAILHPGHDEAIKLWDAYVQNVDPLCKVLHVPTMANLVRDISRKPDAASKGNECLLFAVYYFAVFSMTDVECLQDFHSTKSILASKYQNAVCQALINASWFKTTTMSVLQAYVLFLVAMRTQIDNDTLWILTGIAVRLAQRMGLHRDGQNLGLLPFEVQMRRRLFWQLLLLDSYAGQVSRTGISISPASWDTKQPLNVNDCQIFPHMTQQPQEQRGASEMIFCLSKMELFDLYTRTSFKLRNVGALINSEDSREIERLIDKVEDALETKYLRYCDILNPVHFLTLGIIRSAINAVRLRSRMPPLMEQSIEDPQRRDLCTLALTILDTNATIYRNPETRRFQWQTQAFYLWDAFLCILSSVIQVGLFSAKELNAYWSKIEEVYSNHEEILEGKSLFYITVGRVTLKAWLANPPADRSSEPGFITALRAHSESRGSKRPEGVDPARAEFEVADEAPFFDPLFGNMDNKESSVNDSVGFSASDWAFWGQLFRDTDMNTCS